MFDPTVINVIHTSQRQPTNWTTKEKQILRVCAFFCCFSSSSSLCFSYRWKVTMCFLYNEMLCVLWMLYFAHSRTNKTPQDRSDNEKCLPVSQKVVWLHIAPITGYYIYQHLPIVPNLQSATQTILSQPSIEVFFAFIQCFFICWQKTRDPSFVLLFIISLTICRRVLSCDVSGLHGDLGTVTSIR